MPLPLPVTNYSTVSPAALFAKGEQGVWFDPNDLSTLYQDQFGITAAALEQPVGLMLDKSKGLKRGAELVSNAGPNFVNTTGWLDYAGGTNFSASNGNLVASDDCYFPITGLTIGKVYEVRFSVVSGTGLNLYHDANCSGNYYLLNRTGVGVVKIRVVKTELGLYLNGGTTLAYVSVKEIAGNHATQTLSARPTLSARYNQIVQTEDLGNAIWLLNGATKGGKSSIVMPDGSTNGQIISINAGSEFGVYQNQTFLNGATYTWSIVLAVPSGTQVVRLGYYNGTVTTISNDITVTTTPTRYSFTFTTSNTGSNVSVINGSAGAAVTVVAWGADLRLTEDGVNLPSYQKVNTSTDYSVAGFPYYLVFDGTDDFLGTSSIDFTSTDKMTIWAGVRKYTDASQGIIVELSGDSSSSTNSFGIFASGQGGPVGSSNYRFNLFGSSSRAAYEVGPFVSPITNILAVSFDIGGAAGSEIFGRIDGFSRTLSVLPSLENAGTGNFGNWPLYIGRRNASAAVYFSGRLYQLIIRGAQTTQSLIEAIEFWIDRRTRSDAMYQYSPASLFSNGEEGFWFDNDITTMFQDTAGTIPAALEQPVGLWLDKSKAFSLGNEINTVPDNWSVSSGWTNNGGGSYTGTNNLSIFKIIGGVTPSTYFEVTVTISNYVSGSLRVILRGNTGAISSGNGTKTIRLFSGTSGDDNVYLGGSGGFNGTISGLSIKKVLGNHATQTLAARPTLSAKYNLIPDYSEDFRNTTDAGSTRAWTYQGIILSPNQAVAPDGNTTADLMYPAAGAGAYRSVYRNASGLSGKKITIFAKSAGISHLWIVDAGGGNIAAWFNLSTGVKGTVVSGYTHDMVSVGNGWYRCTVEVASGSFNILQIGLSDSDNNTTATQSGTNGIYIWGADIRRANDGVGLPSYQRVNTATDYEVSGFPYYLKFDGVDDMLFTNSIDLTKTDKLTVFAAVRKIATTTQIISEFSIVTAGNAGAFYVAGYSSTYEFSFRGSGTEVWYTPEGYSSPISNILTCTFDIGGDSKVTELFPRINGVLSQTGGSGSTAGTGNFGNYVLYIGQRGNSTYPLNGRIYNLIGRGAKSSDTKVINTETWLNRKNKVY